MRESESTSRKQAKHLRRNLTNAEVRLWGCLRSKKLNGNRFRRQHPIGPYITDFACLAHKLIVEVDGATHSTDAEIAHDQRRSAFLGNKGWQVLRVTNSDVYENLEGVLETIASTLPPSVSGADTSPAYGGGNSHI